MRSIVFTLAIAALCTTSSLLNAQDLKKVDPTFKKAKVDFDAYENLVRQVKAHRKSRLLSLNEFVKKSKGNGVIILDTRSDVMYQRKHIKGAVHLNFSDFTQANLARVIPNPETVVLIYCNNNFDGDELNFATKAVLPKMVNRDVKPITLALNIPTYINLYGYGYRNVYELSELVSVSDKRIIYEGAAVGTIPTQASSSGQK